MNENLNLKEILKDCPAGTEFYSTIYGCVYFDYIDLSCKYSVILKTLEGIRADVSSDGRHYLSFNGECTLFPSKNQRDWSKWHIPFKDGDVVYANVDDISYILIYHKQEDNTIYCHVCFCLETNTLSYDERIFTKDPVSELRYTSEEEKQLFFDVIREQGYKWNQETKTLEKLIIPKFKVGDTIRIKNGLQTYEVTNVTSEYYSVRISGCVGILPVKDQDDYILIPDKFDPNTLVPFESKVLVRDSNHLSWRGSIYTHRDENNFYTVNGTYYLQCIPYNDDTAHLIGTDKEAPEYYKY